MKFKELRDFIIRDLMRYEENVNIFNFLRYVFFTPGFKYSYHMRKYRYLSENKIFKYLKPIYKLRLKHYTYKYGIQIPIEASIGKGILIRHFGGIFINPDCTIGENFTISQGVTIGVNKGGVPIIGDNVFIAPGAKVIGKIVIGNNVTIGVNSVITKDVPSNAVVGGNPMKILYYKEIN